MCAGRGCLCSKGRRTQKEYRVDLDCLEPWIGFCIRFRFSATTCRFAEQPDREKVVTLEQQELFEVDVRGL